jgi:hypothetical protein
MIATPSHSGERFRTVVWAHDAALNSVTRIVVQAVPNEVLKRDDLGEELRGEFPLYSTGSEPARSSLHESSGSLMTLVTDLE